jgi:hypothetical protein
VVDTETMPGPDEIEPRFALGEPRALAEEPEHAGHEGHGRREGRDSMRGRGWSSDALAVLRAHVAGVPAVPTAPAGLRALRHHDGLALIAEERRALHTARVLLGELLQAAIRAAWPATNDTQRAELQDDVRELLGAYASHVAHATFRGVTLLDGSCPMVGIQASPGSTEFLVLALRNLSPHEVGVHSVDLATPTGARMARVALRQALDTLAATEELLVHDLHELLAGRTATS